MIKLQTKIVLSKKFWLFMTAYTVISTVALLSTTGGYSLIYMFFYVGPLYFLAWLLLSFCCLTSSRIRYSRVLSYLVLFFFSIVFLFNIEDAGFYGVTCSTKNFIQYFFDHSECSGLWVSQGAFVKFIALYIFSVIVFVLDVLRLRSLSIWEEH